MITVTKEELIEFVMAQSDNEPVDMDQIHSDDTCGCLMVQYGRSRGWTHFGCTYNKWITPVGRNEYDFSEPVATLQGHIKEIIPYLLFESIKTHSDIKRLLAANPVTPA